MNVTEKAMINLAQLAEQQKNYRAEKKNGNLKQAHDVQLAEDSEPITKTLK